MAAIAARDFELVGLDALEQPGRLELGHHLLARFKAIQSLQVSRGVLVQTRIGREQIDHRQLMALADRVVIEIVRRRDLHATGAETRIHVSVGNDRDLAPDQR